MRTPRPIGDLPGPKSTHVYVFLGITATPGLTIYYATTKKLKKLVNAAICWLVGRF